MGHKKPHQKNKNKKKENPTKKKAQLKAPNSPAPSHSPPAQHHTTCHSPLLSSLYRSTAARQVRQVASRIEVEVAVEVEIKAKKKKKSFDCEYCAKFGSFAKVDRAVLRDGRGVRNEGQQLTRKRERERKKRKNVRTTPDHDNEYCIHYKMNKKKILLH